MIMSRFKCNKTAGCKRCGGCCIIRDEAILNEAEDKKVRESIYNKTGILYIYPLHKLTLSLTPDELKAVEKEAKKRNIALNIKPKKVTYNCNNDTIKVIDWCIDSKVCPFLKGNACIIYSKRPEICRKFPFIEAQKLGEIYKENAQLPFEYAMKKAKELWMMK